MLLFGLSALLFGAAFCAGWYLFAAYVMWRVGEKFRVGRYLDYLVPVWNIMLICDCAGITRWTAAGLVLPAAVVLVWGPAFYVWRAASALFVFCWVYLWGSVAESLGKNFWLWGAACLFFGGIPVLFFAFDGSMPRR